MQSVRVVHLFSSFRGLGGVEAVLGYHYERDRDYGLDSRFVIYFEPAGEPLHRVEFLELTGRSSIRDARKKLRAALAGARPEIAFYHGVWGIPFLADLDHALRRVLVLHGETPRLKQHLQVRRAWLDGVLCVSEPLREIASTCAPELGSSRLQTIPYPVSPVGAPMATRSMKERPVVLGFCGRLIAEQKRVDRLPRLCRLLDERGIQYRLEFLGEGPSSGWLQEQLPNRAKFVFHGRQTGPQFWAILKGWDAIIFVSDYEGTPIGMLEALSMGVIPVYPRINSGGDACVGKLDVKLLYDPDDLEQAAEAVRRIKSFSSEELDSLRRRCREAVAGHVDDSYLRQFSRFAREILAQPPVAQARFPRHLWPIERLPFSFLERISVLCRPLRLWQR